MWTAAAHSVAEAWHAVATELFGAEPLHSSEHHAATPLAAPTGFKLLTSPGTPTPATITRHAGPAGCGSSFLLDSGGQAAVLGMVKEDVDPFKDPNVFAPVVWRRQHNYFVDRGTKFMVTYKSPVITGTDLFDLEKFGCYQTRGPQGPNLLPTQAKFKEWWKHPMLTFGAKFKRIGVSLQDLTTGEVRWDAVYDIGKAAHKTRKNDRAALECDGETGMGLCPQEKPIGGSHPFFQPDWCPAPGDSLAHKYKLTITNLSQRELPEQPLVGEMFFTQYGPSQLANSYAFENNAPEHLS